MFRFEPIVVTDCRLQWRGLSTLARRAAHTLLGTINGDHGLQVYAGRWIKHIYQSKTYQPIHISRQFLHN